MAKKPAASKATHDKLKAAAPAAETATTTHEAAVEASTERMVDEALNAQKNSDPILVHDELLDMARGIKADFADQGTKEDDKTYLCRLMEVISDLDDPTFDTMQQKTQDWYNDTARAESTSKPWPHGNPEGFSSKFGGKADAKAPKAPKAAAEKAPKAAKAPPPAKGPSITLKVRELVCANPGMKLEELEKQLAAVGHVVKKSTTSTIRSDVLATIQAAKNVGVWKS
jgi:hypothetical protein